MDNEKIDINNIRELCKQFKLEKLPYIEDVIDNIINFKIMDIPEFDIFRRFERHTSLSKLDGVDKNLTDVKKY